MKLFITFTILLGLTVCALAQAVTPDQNRAKYLQSSVNVIVNNYQNSVSNFNNAKAQAKEYQTLMQLSGINWNGILPTNGGVNWSQVK